MPTHHLTAIVSTPGWVATFAVFFLTVLIIISSSSSGSSTFHLVHHATSTALPAPAAVELALGPAHIIYPSVSPAIAASALAQHADSAPAAAVSAPVPGPALKATPTHTPLPSVAPSTPTPAVFLVTQANRPNAYLCSLVESSLFNDLPQIVVGWVPNAPLPATMAAVSWQNQYFLSARIVHYYSLLTEPRIVAEFPEDSLFVFADYDVIVQFGPGELAARYNASITKIRGMGGRMAGMSAFVSSELNGPYDRSAPDGPPEGAPWGNLCAGLMMGDRAGMLGYLSALMKHTNATLLDRSHLIEFNDQILLTQLWAKGDLPLALDWYMDVFLSMNIPDNKPGVTIDPTTGHGDWRGHFLFDERADSPTQGKLQAVHTKSFPVFIHFNGFSKASGGSPSTHAYGYEQLHDKFAFVRERPDRARPHFAREKFQRLVKFFDEQLQPVHGVQPEDVCPPSTPLDVT